MFLVLVLVIVASIVLPNVKGILRINLLSIKERQLRLYEQSLLSLKEEVNIMQSDVELKQTKVNEKEIALLRKELKLKEKQRDLEQLEEKLAQIDTIQLEREKSKMSNPSVMINSEVKNSELNNKTKTYIKKSKVKVNNLISQDPEIKVEKKIENKTENKVEPEKKTEVDKPKNKVKSNKTVAESYVNSGLGQMKKDILDVE